MATSTETLNLIIRLGETEIARLNLENENELLKKAIEQVNDNMPEMVDVINSIEDVKFLRYSALAYRREHKLAIDALADLRDFMSSKMAMHLSEDFAANPDNPDPDRPWTLKFDIGDINYILTGKRE